MVGENAAECPFRVEQEMACSGKVRSVRTPLDVTPEHWRELVAVLRAKNTLETCLITRQRIPPAHAKKKEHVVLQGLGIHWAELPPGLVDDRVNNSASAAEKAFLQLGLMGTLRPLYVNARKSIVFQMPSGKRIEFAREPGDGFAIRLYGDFGDLPDEATGTGELTFRLPVEEPATLLVSRAIHKLSYLLLCVLDPDLALTSALDGTRAFIADPRSGNYRPFLEVFVPRSPSGFHVNVQAEWDGRKPGVGTLKRVLIRLRLHHVLYGLDLLGRLPAPPLQLDAEYHPSPRPRRRRIHELTWHFDSMEPA
ncbi:MAG: hypothetical protein HY898_27910 [Deltaproteobacteria bacterium]|nr:hypothetical protein [Deltaproteobacteria bacterium]